MRDANAQRAIDKLGAAIREARVAQGFSQEGFARHVGLDRSYFGSVERGRFNLRMETLTKIADGLNTPAWKLLKAAEDA
jgi:transcriptional regulator with XRE-family HTH domain